MIITECKSSADPAWRQHKETKINLYHVCNNLFNQTKNATRFWPT